MPIQVIDERAFPNIPASCSSSGTAEDTLDTLGANAILGIGLFRQDCGLPARSSGRRTRASTTRARRPAASRRRSPLVSQVQNPVALFPTDNNGVVIQLPAVPAGGAVSVTGSLIFGIGTQSNNALGSAKVLTVDAIGNITTVFGSRSYPAELHRLRIERHLLPRFGHDGPPAVPGQLGLLLSGLAAISVRDKQRHERRDQSPSSFNVGTPTRSIRRFFAFSEIAGPNPGGFDLGLGVLLRPERVHGHRGPGHRRVAPGHTSRIDVASAFRRTSTAG